MRVIYKINQDRLGKIFFAVRGPGASKLMMKREQLSSSLHNQTKGTTGGELEEKGSMEMVVNGHLALR